MKRSSRYFSLETTEKEKSRKKTSRVQHLQMSYLEFFVTVGGSSFWFGSARFWSVYVLSRYVRSDAVRFCVVPSVHLGWVGLGRVGLSSVGLGWVGLGWVGLGWVGLGGPQGLSCRMTETQLNRR